MMCNICGLRKAVMMIQQVTNEGKKELYLCLNCAKERGITPGNGKLETTLTGLFENLNRAVKKDRLCPVCGTSASVVETRGTVGCPECYNIFAKELKESLEKVNQTGPYTGSLPQRLAHFKSVLTDRMLLKNKLEQSIAKEEYEKAATYRDLLKTLDKCAVANGEGPLHE